MDAVGLVLAIVGGVLSFLTCRPDLSPEGIAGATACSVVQSAIAPGEPAVDEKSTKEMPAD